MDPPVEFHILTHTGNPKVTQPWTPEVEVRQCPSQPPTTVTENNSTGKPNTEKTGRVDAPTPVQLIEKSGAAKHGFAYMIFALVWIVIKMF